MKWYGKEMLQLINFICIFELVFLSTTAIASVLRYQVIFSVGGFILLGCHALIFMLWNFTLVLLVNLLAINIGSSAAFTLVMVVQMTCTAALSIITVSYTHLSEFQDKYESLIPSQCYAAFAVPIYQITHFLPCCGKSINILQL